MTDPTSNPVRKWLWPLVIALLAVLLLVWLLNPAGEGDAEVEDPIVTGDVSEPVDEPIATDTEALPSE